MNNRKATAKKPVKKIAAKKAVPSKKVIAKAVAKPVAKKAIVKAVAKPVAKKAIAKVVAKPVAKKAIVKAVAKPIAKKAIVKAVAKPVAKKAIAKVVAKPVAKKAIVKAVAKPVVKKEIAKVVAKPVVKKAIAKAVAKPVVKKEIAKVVAKPVAKKVTVKAAAKPVVKKEIAKVVAKPVAKKVTVKATPIDAPQITEVTVPLAVSEATIDDLPESVTIAAKVLFKLRAEKVQVIDLRGHSDIADFFVVGTCGSEAQMQAILTGLQREFKTAKLENYGIEYREGVRWAVFDGIETMVHLFEEDARSEYALERLWRDGKLVDLKEEDYQQASAEDSSDDDFV